MRETPIQWLERQIASPQTAPEARAIYRTQLDELKHPPTYACWRCLDTGERYLPMDVGDGVGMVPFKCAHD